MGLLQETGDYISWNVSSKGPDVPPQWTKVPTWLLPHLTKNRLELWADRVAKAERGIRRVWEPGRALFDPSRDASPIYARCALMAASFFAFFFAVPEDGLVVRSSYVAVGTIVMVSKVPPFCWLATWNRANQ